MINQIKILKENFDLKRKERESAIEELEKFNRDREANLKNLKKVEDEENDLK